MLLSPEGRGTLIQRTAQLFMSWLALCMEVEIWESQSGLSVVEFQQ